MKVDTKTKLKMGKVIVEALNFKGAHMLFPFKNIYKGKIQEGYAKVELRISFIKR